jgi:hypothetical protein
MQMTNNNDSASGGNGVSLWARQSAPAQQRVTARVRNLVESLPDWEPLPPGEILVRRRQR